jgi:hypothetical protein
MSLTGSNRRSPRLHVTYRKHSLFPRIHHALLHPPSHCAVCTSISCLVIRVWNAVQHHFSLRWSGTCCPGHQRARSPSEEPMASSPSRKPAVARGQVLLQEQDFLQWALLCSSTGRLTMGKEDVVCRLQRHFQP